MHELHELTGMTWFAFNKNTGDFACLTSYLKMSRKKRLSSYVLAFILEFVKINDPDIPKENTMTFKEGFNMIFENIFK